MDRTDIGGLLIAIPLLIGLAAWIVVGIRTLGWWCALAIPVWFGLVLITWDALTD